MQTQKGKYLMGGDPEFMVVKSGNIVSSIPFMKGDKYDKEILGKGGYTTYADNVNIECTFPPADSPKNLVDNLKTLFTRLKKSHPEFSITTRASHTFSEEECDNDLAKKFGCDPEFDVYALDIVNPPAGGHTFRSAGGHIHLGNKTFNNNPSGYLIEQEDKFEAIKLMDLLVGIPLILMDNDPTSPARKKLYGKAGRFRPTDYGVEYRTPSPYWTSNPRIAALTAELTFMVMNIGDAKQGAEILSQFNSEDIQNAINNNDKDLARGIFEKLTLPENIKQSILEISQEQLNQDIYQNW